MDYQDIYNRDGITSVVIDGKTIVIARKDAAQRLTLSYGQLAAIMAAVKAANGHFDNEPVKNTDSNPTMRIARDPEDVMALRSAAAAASYELGAALGRPRNRGNVVINFDIAMRLYKTLNDAIDRVEIISSRGVS